MRPVWIRKVGTVEGSSLSSLTLSCWRIPGMGRLFPTEVKWSKCVGHYPPHPVQGCVNSFTLLKGWINLARDYFCCPCCWEKEDNVFLNIYLDMSTCQHVNLSKCQSLQLVNLESVLRELDPQWGTALGNYWPPDGSGYLSEFTIFIYDLSSCCHKWQNLTLN